MCNEKCSSFLMKLIKLRGGSRSGTLAIKYSIPALGGNFSDLYCSLLSAPLPYFASLPISSLSALSLSPQWHHAATACDAPLIPDDSLFPSCLSRHPSDMARQQDNLLSVVCVCVVQKIHCSRNQHCRHQREGRKRGTPPPAPDRTPFAAINLMSTTTTAALSILPRFPSPIHFGQNLILCPLDVRSCKR